MFVRAGRHQTVVCVLVCLLLFASRVSIGADQAVSRFSSNYLSSQLKTIDSGSAVEAGVSLQPRPGLFATNVTKLGRDWIAHRFSTGYGGRSGNFQYQLSYNAANKNYLVSSHYEDDITLQSRYRYLRLRYQWAAEYTQEEIGGDYSFGDFSVDGAVGHRQSLLDRAYAEDQYSLKLGYRSIKWRGKLTETHDNLSMEQGAEFSPLSWLRVEVVEQSNGWETRQRIKWDAVRGVYGIGLETSRYRAVTGEEQASTAVSWSRRFRHFRLGTMTAIANGQWVSSQLKLEVPVLAF